MQILIVEDEALIAMEVEAILLDAGYVVRGPASTAERALQIASSSAPDLALVDINLRDGHGTGIRLARELMTLHRTPSLFTSGQREAALSARDAALGYLRKPYRPESLLGSVEVSKRWIAGEPVVRLPHGLEWFR